MKIAVDFDGTCVSHEFPEVGRDAPGAVDVLQRLAKEGHLIFLFTMRSGKYLADAVKWFNNNKIPLSGINQDPEQEDWSRSPKCYAQLYIDDAAFGCPLIQPPGFQRPCVNWEAVETELLTVKTAAELAGQKHIATGLEELESCVICHVPLCHVDEDPNGTYNGKCAKCLAEEDHDYDAEPDVEFNRDGTRVGE